MIMKIINNAYRLIEEKERKINLIHYLEYQLRLFEEKTWEVVESKKYINQEFADRAYAFYKRKIKELLEEQKELIDDLKLINMILSLHEEFAWQEVQVNSSFFYFLLFLLDLHPFQNSVLFHAKLFL